MLPPLLDIRNVSVRRQTFGEVVTLFEGLNLSIEQGENVAIIGANGSGKSSLLALLQGQLRPLAQSGSSIRIMGKKAINIWEFRRYIGLVSPQLQQSYRPDVRGEDVLLSGYYSSIGLWAHQKYTEEQYIRVKHIAQQLEIEPLLRRYYCQMSTGEQRRFLLGRALIHNPQTLIFDEPTSGLDIKAKYHYLSWIRWLLRQGNSMILVTHHLEEIPAEITRVILMSEGRIVADGEKSDIITTDNLSVAYGIPVTVHLNENGHYRIHIDEGDDLGNLWNTQDEPEYPPRR